MTLQQLIDEFEKRAKHEGFAFKVLQVHPAGTSIEVAHKPKVRRPLDPDESDHWHKWKRTT